MSMLPSQNKEILDDTTDHVIDPYSFKILCRISFRGDISPEHSVMSAGRGRNRFFAVLHAEDPRRG